jgi:hypothetical protein
MVWIEKVEVCIFKLAKEVDPSGFRTLLVLTKLDRMDAGTDASSLLNGNIINIKLGIIGLVNNTELDNKKDKSLEQAEKDETSYTSKLSKVSVEMWNWILKDSAQSNFFRSRENLFSRIRSKILIQYKLQIIIFVSLKVRVNELISKYESDVNENDIGESHTVIARKMNAFIESYKASVFGSGLDLDVDKLSSGARVVRLFQQLNDELFDISCQSYLSDEDVMVSISNARPLEGMLSQTEVCNHFHAIFFIF